ncbi:MAG: hypothetical protein WBV23_06085 [Desulfobaccales bacterium]
MKTWSWLLLAMLALMVGCAPGYEAPKPAYPTEAPAFRDTGMWHQNPETESERELRIWREESGR